MKYLLTVRRAMLLATTCASLEHGGLVLAGEDAGSADPAPVVGTRAAMNGLRLHPVAAALQAASGAGSEAQGNVAELMQMIHDSQLTGLRTTCNGSYGAGLFFYPQEMTYYVALFQDRHFWRVIKSQDDTRAEAVYAGFVQQTAQLADVEIRQAQLQVQKASAGEGQRLPAPDTGRGACIARREGNGPSPATPGAKRSAAVAASR
jgi:hypothetical protein